jgi:hypothetical protein
MEKTFGTNCWSRSKRDPQKALKRGVLILQPQWHMHFSKNLITVLSGTIWSVSVQVVELVLGRIFHILGLIGIVQLGYRCVLSSSIIGLGTFEFFVFAFRGFWVSLGVCVCEEVNVVADAGV